MKAINRRLWGFVHMAMIFAPLAALGWWIAAGMDYWIGCTATACLMFGLDEDGRRTG